jgi:peptide/nickel transport system substrate-binding protein
LSDLPLFIQNKLSLGLTTLDQKGQPSPGLAESWESTDSGRIYLFYLRPNLRWSDNHLLKSSDINLNYRDLSLSYPDNSTLKITLKEPYSPLTSVLSKPIIKYQSPDWFHKSRVLTLGGYKLASYRERGGILDSLNIVPVKNSGDLPKITYHFYSNVDMAITALKLGEISSLENLSDPGNIPLWSNFSLTQKISYDKFIGVFYNTADPLFSGPSGKNLRLALTYAIDKTRWENRAFGPIPPVSWAYLTDLKTYNQDMDKARSLIKKVEKLPDPLILNVLPAYFKIAEQVKSDWEQLGIKVSLVTTTTLSAEYQSLLLAQNIPVDPDQYNLWHSRQENSNISKINNPRIDKLLEDGRKETNSEKRRQIYFEFQKYLLEECPTAFLYYPVTYTLSKN